MTPIKKKERVRKIKESARAYEYWLANPTFSKTEVCNSFKVQLDDLAYWMKVNGKPRPDGKVVGKGSPRQVALRHAYESAIEQKQDLEWALALAKKSFSSISRGDICYYWIKNELTPLPEGTRLNRLSATKYG